MISGAVTDVWLNLETGETGFKYISADHPMCIYIPRGYAHGFQAETDCTMLYYQDRPFNTEVDRGFDYRSAEFKWCDEPILSERDKGHEYYCNRK